MEVEGFGEKKIGLIGGIALMVNNLLGPGTVLFPALYQQAGILPCVATLIASTLMALLACVLLIKAIALIPGNSNFELRMEFQNLAQHYFSRQAYLWAQLVFQLSVLTVLMSTIIQSVQSLDGIFVDIFGKSCGLEVYPAVGFVCGGDHSGETPFPSNHYLISAGFVACGIICIPLGYWNLDDNIMVQNVATTLIFVCASVWMGLSFSFGLETDRTPIIGSDTSQVLGVTVFNFAFVFTLPSWLNEKKRDTSVTGVIVSAMAIGVAIFFAIGVIGGMAFEPYYESSDDFLAKLREHGGTVAMASIYVYPIACNWTSIPILCIVMRYNFLQMLENNSYAKLLTSLVVIAPWVLSLPFYPGSGFDTLCNWGGIVFATLANFIFPVAIYVSALKMYIIPKEDLLSDSNSERASDYSPPMPSLPDESGLGMLKERLTVDTLPRGETTSLDTIPKRKASYWYAGHASNDITGDHTWQIFKSLSAKAHLQMAYGLIGLITLVIFEKEIANEYMPLEMGIQNEA
ncbi:hypothetical protein CYMTET_28548 [Cymbomonas tetramitiformis]|uniref:Amino acid transporter transmembrane domain-containing protein n=1 Tax=Cymbomonas tetramitiformis TaxID=36881 RepID=A0AAE0FN95_9CHLO|nr:hypothetical protein CYMTET_28548 [Cymbomonas tetramitiformis]